MAARQEEWVAMYCNGKLIAQVGDSIDVGGRVLGSESHMDDEGLLLAHAGSPALCAVHGMTYVKEGTAHIFTDGKRLACDGDRLACGDRILVQRQGHSRAEFSDISQSSLTRRVVNAAPIPGERSAQSSRVATRWDLSQYLRIVDTDGVPLAGTAFIKWTACGASVEGCLTDEGTSQPIVSDRAGLVYYAFAAPMAKDHYDFNGHQHLGMWTEEGVAGKARTLLKGALRAESPLFPHEAIYDWHASSVGHVYNESFQKYRERHHRGGDFFIYSDVYWKDVDYYVDLGDALERESQPYVG